MFNLIQTTPSCSVFLSVSRLVTRRNEIFSVFENKRAQNALDYRAKRHRKPQMRQVDRLSQVGKSSCTIYSIGLSNILPFPLTAIDSYGPNSRRDFPFASFEEKPQPIFKLAIWSWPWSKVDPGLYFILEFQRWGVMEKWKFKCLSISTAMIGAISRTAWRRIAEYTVSFDKSFRAEILKIHSNSNTAFREGSESAAFENSSFRRKLCDISRKHKRRRMEFSRVQMSDIKFQRVSVSLWNDELLATIWQCTDLRNVARAYYSKLFNYVW